LTKPAAAWSDADLSRVAQLKEAHAKIIQQIRKAVVGQEQVVNELMIVLFAQGHGLLMGVPGLAKTLLVRTLASSLSLQFRRVQFTPDLMPSDITGTEVIQEDKATGERRFKFLQGPSSRTCSWPTRSTARRPRPRPHCSKPCRKSR